MMERYDRRTIGLLAADGQRILRIDPVTAEADTLFGVQVSNRDGFIPFSPGGLFQLRQPFGDADRWGVSGDGKAALRLHQDITEVPPGLSAEVTVFSDTGEPVTRWIAPTQVTPLEDDLVDEAIGAWMPSTAVDHFGSRWEAERAFRRALFRPPVIPLRGMVLDSENRVWIEEWTGGIFHLPLRQTEGFLGSLARMLEIDLSIPAHTALSRRRSTEPAGAGIGQKRGRAYRRGSGWISSRSWWTDTARKPS